MFFGCLDGMVLVVWPYVRIGIPNTPPYTMYYVYVLFGNIIFSVMVADAMPMSYTH